MKNVLSKKNFSLLRTMPGFTMIELLVVIAVIGVLAVAVLSSINPIEQINKGRDTRTRSDAAQLINAVDRYFAIHEEYPWNTTANDWVGIDGDPAYAEAFDSTTVGTWDWITVLVDTAEVKEGFVNRVEADDTIRVFKAAGANATMYACFRPSSQAFVAEATDNCEDGTTPDFDFSDGDATCAVEPEDNYICLP